MSAGPEHVARPGRGGVPALAAGAVLAVAVMVVVRAIRGGEIWTAGEGVYALTSRMVLDGSDLYGELIAVQPPWLFLTGAAVLAVDDSLSAIHAAMGALQVLTAVLAAVLTWRITGSRAAALVTAPLALLTPWAVHENATFLPELLAMPLALGAALLAARPRTSAAAGVLLALAVFVKLPMLAPLVLLGLAAARPRAFAVAAAATLAVQAVVFTALFGGDLWTSLFTTQVGTGTRPADILAGLVGQGLWNSGWLVALAIVGVVLRRHATDPAAMRAAIGLAAGALVTCVTVTKNGTGLYVLTFLDVALLPLVVAGAVWAVRSAGRRRLPVAAGLAAVGLLLLAQTASLLRSSTDPRPFVRPGATPGYGATFTEEEVTARVAEARACPPGAPYSGPVTFAFLARRPMPAGQPDTYIIWAAPRLADVLAEARAAPGRCP